MMGISKEELLSSYYLEELGEVFYEYHLLQGRGENAGDSFDSEFVEYVEFGAFFGF